VRNYVKGIMLMLRNCQVEEKIEVKVEAELKAGSTGICKGLVVL